MLRHDHERLGTPFGQGDQCELAGETMSIGRENLDVSSSTGRVRASVSSPRDGVKELSWWACSLDWIDGSWRPTN